MTTLAVGNGTRAAARSPANSAPAATDNQPGAHSGPSHELRHAFTAVRLSLRWLGVRKTLSGDQKQQAADPFGAEGQYLSAAKKLLDTKHPAYKAVTAVRGRAVSYWKGTSVPYPEPGLRLIRRSDIERFNQQMRQLREELNESVTALDRAYGELREHAKDRLGRLYDPGDYPASLAGLFAIEWDFPSVEPPSYLQQLNPELFEQERQRVAARFDEAVQLAEQAFTEEFGKLVNHLTERLEGDADGKPKIFRDSAVGNLHTFFDRFRQLNVHSNEQLDQLVEQAQQVVRGVAPNRLRTSEPLRQRVAKQLQQVQGSLEDLLVDRPRRRILRPGGSAASSAKEEP
ncbi:hypothetical protein ACERK3_16255 [Phycisphaerales bacterium AB-hyl4]|uniref:DUF3150 domain-containing protein n=1 Tax=Natronomicrosphaera hydrolytica TaxID=3242702 RepID=A0ABV4U897_9BACT